MLFYTHNPSKFAFSREKSDFESYISSNSDDIVDKKIFGLVGVPFDSTTTYKSGARYGPSAIREASYSFENYNLSLDKRFNTFFFDFGDLEAVPGNVLKTFEKLHETVLELLNNGIIPLIIGGEHSISLGILSALKEYRGLDDVTIVHFDAHMDLIDSYMDEKYSHATVMRRIFDLKPAKIIQLGVRSASLEEKKFADKEPSIDYYTASNIKNNPDYISSVLKEINGPVYISLDMDVMDPAHAPSVGNPTPCGLDAWEIQKFIEILSPKNVLGMDLVEVASVEIGDITSINGAKIIYDFLCLNG
ncbi:MAG: agmatinase [Methanobacteriaceae archaeon]|nr:agmatinase [Methanobacteriaceae archaeon]